MENFIRNLIAEKFQCPKFQAKIKSELPKLFLIAELESSRGGKAGMQAGSVRETIIIAILMHEFGKSNIDGENPITTKEKDVVVFGEEISIKTKTGLSYSGIKIVWTNDLEQVRKFIKNYKPSTSLIFVQINWGSTGFLHYIPLEVQNDIFSNLNINNYLRPPPLGKNGRGIEITSKALKLLVNDPRTIKIPIEFPSKDSMEINPFERWIELLSD